MTLVRWTPEARMTANVRDSFDEMIRGFFGDPWVRGSVREWTPATDVTEEEHQYSVTIDLPGLKRDDIKISVANGMLTVSGERKRESESKEQGYVRVEREHGSFARTFTLPRTVDGKRIEASYKDGVLTIALPKSEDARPKSIDVKVN
jgi:HSP20 family protein